MSGITTRPPGFEPRTIGLEGRSQTERSPTLAPAVAHPRAAGLIFFSPPCRFLSRHKPGACYGGFMARRDNMTMTHEMDDGFANEAARNHAAVSVWSAADCSDRCCGWVLTASDAWVRCRGCNARGAVPHPEDDCAWSTFVASYVVTVEDRVVLQSQDRATAADRARDLRDAGKAPRLRRLVS